MRMSSWQQWKRGSASIQEDELSQRNGGRTIKRGCAGLLSIVIFLGLWLESENILPTERSRRRRPFFQPS